MNESPQIRLSVMRGPAPDAPGVELGLTGLDLAPNAWSELEAAGVRTEDPDVWVLVTVVGDEDAPSESLMDLRYTVTASELAAVRAAAEH